MVEEANLLEMPGMWDLPWLYAAGEVGGRYITELRDNARLMATKCPECGRVLLPPRSFCERCFVSLKDHWVELKPEGTLEAFTVITGEYSFSGMPKPPYVMCLVRLGGASTSIPQMLLGLDLSDPGRAAKELKVGMPVKAVFMEQREGRIDDFHIELIR